MLYENDLLTRKKGPIGVMTCPSDSDDYFMMLKLSDDRVILGCGESEYHLTIVEQVLQTMKNYLVITGDDVFSQLSFTVIDSSHLFLVGTLYSQINNSYYKGGIITLSFDGGAQDPIIDSENHLAYY